MNTQKWTIMVLDRPIDIEITWVGEDLSVLVTGGDKPHIGSISMATPRESLTGIGQSATVSTFVYPGHKDDVVGNQFAKALCVKHGCKVVVTCGIHYKGIGLEGLKLIDQKLKQFLIETERKD